MGTGHFSYFGYALFSSPISPVLIAWPPRARLATRRPPTRPYSPAPRVSLLYRFSRPAYALSHAGLRPASPSRTSPIAASVQIKFTLQSDIRDRSTSITAPSKTYAVYSLYSTRRAAKYQCEMPQSEFHFHFYFNKSTTSFRRLHDAILFSFTFGASTAIRFDAERSRRKRILLAGCCCWGIL
jgi:hypothetical protein